eukprot:11926812-Prorocentrum_lima.AAC.1
MQRGTPLRLRAKVGVADAAMVGASLTQLKKAMGELAAPQAALPGLRGASEFPAGAPETFFHS